MPTQKKRKTHKHPDSQHAAGLSHAEVWDDSALVQSWNEALAEYEYYHSIHARGEDVDEILRQAELGELAERNVDVDSPGHADAHLHQHGGRSDDQDDAVEEGEVDEDACPPDEEALQLQLAKQALARRLEFDASAPPPQPSDSRAADVMDEHQRPPGQVDPPTAPPVGPNVATAAPAGPATDAPRADLSAQTLENLKMAYYWAGYYSGLYDGQRQAVTSAPLPADVHKANAPPAPAVAQDPS